MSVKLTTPSTGDLEKTKSGKLSYDGFVPGKRVAQGLYVGSIVDSANIDFMRRHNITVVVNCTRDLPFRFPKQHHIRLPVHDAYEETLNLFNLWKTQVPRISTLLSPPHNRHVLIHCAMAQQRSIATAAAIVMYREGLSAADAISRMKRLKSDAFWPRINFYRSLMRWQTWLKTHKPPGRAARSL